MDAIVPEPSYDLRPIKLSDVRDLCKKYHGYGSAGASATYAFGVFENDILVAAYAWQPPPPGAALSVCPEAPAGVLSLSRMVAVPKDQRTLNHVSKPLRRQMRILIDRNRWPVLVTYSDEGQGHTGHVYKCSGWEATSKTNQPFFLDSTGARASRYSNGKSNSRNLILAGHTTIQRWEHWICPRGQALQTMSDGGWVRTPVPNKFYRSGKQAHTYIQCTL